MYPVVYDRVHICPHSYTAEYKCTVTYTTDICVLCRVRQCLYIVTNFDRGYVTICTITASLCTISEVRSLSEDIARYVRSLHHWVRSVRGDHSAKISYDMYDHWITGYDQWDAITQRRYRTAPHHWVQSVRCDHSAKISYDMDIALPTFTK